MSVLIPHAPAIWIWPTLRNDWKIILALQAQSRSSSLRPQCKGHLLSLVHRNETPKSCPSMKKVETTPDCHFARPTQPHPDPKAQLTRSPQLSFHLLGTMYWALFVTTTKCFISVTSRVQSAKAISWGSHDELWRFSRNPSNSKLLKRLFVFPWCRKKLVFFDKTAQFEGISWKSRFKSRGTTALSKKKLW